MRRMLSDRPFILRPHSAFNALTGPQHGISNPLQTEQAEEVKTEDVEWSSIYILSTFPFIEYDSVSTASSVPFEGADGGGQ